MSKWVPDIPMKKIVTDYLFRLMKNQGDRNIAVYVK